MAKRGFQGAMMRATQARDHVCTVIGSELVVPGFMRVYLQSDTVFEDRDLAPTVWLRLWFPDHTGKDFEHQCAYTISSGNVETGEFAIDLVLQEPAGPASAWAKTCVPGDTIEAMSLGSSKFELPEEMPAGTCSSAMQRRFLGSPALSRPCLQECRSSCTSRSTHRPTN